MLEPHDRLDLHVQSVVVPPTSRIHNPVCCRCILGFGFDLTGHHNEGHHNDDQVLTNHPIQANSQRIADVSGHLNLFNQYMITVQSVYQSPGFHRRSQT